MKFGENGPLQEGAVAERQESRVPFMTVFRIRHGDTEYKEQLKGEMNNDLTDVGKEQIRRSAEAICNRIDPNQDIVWVIASPRVRTQDSKQIIEEVLKKAGIQIWDGARITSQRVPHSSTFERIRNFDFLTDGSDGTQVVVPTGDERYPGIFKKVVADLETEVEGVPASQQAHLSQHPQLEKAADRIARTRNQLTYLMRIARQIQPKLQRRIVIIQAEHTESIDDLIENASHGTRTEKQGTGIPKGGVVEVNFPTDTGNNELGVHFLDTDERFSIGYDPNKRSFSRQ